MTGAFAKTAFVYLVQQEPLNFGDGEKEISDYWQKYYEELGVPVPLGQPGTNPWVQENLMIHT